MPAFAGKNTTLTFKSNVMTLVISADDGVFNKDNVQAGIYRVYAKQKNCLSVYLGEYDTSSGAVSNTNAVTLPCGDVNADNVIDIADITVLMSVANFGKTQPALDLTGDGLITIDDVALALQVGNYGEASVENI